MLTNVCEPIRFWGGKRKRYPTLSSPSNLRLITLVSDIARCMPMDRITMAQLLRTNLPQNAGQRNMMNPPSWHLIYNQSLGRGFLSTYSPLGGVWRTEPHSGAPLPFHPIVTFILLFLFIFPAAPYLFKLLWNWGLRTFKKDDAHETATE